MNISGLASAWPSLKWRHHGTGMLQAYTTEAKDERVHIWHRSLLHDGMETGGPMHNHRFAFISRLLVGSLTHTRIRIMRSVYADTHAVWDISPKGADGDDSDLVEIDVVDLEFYDKCMVKAPESYFMNKWDYHWARQEADDAALTVTLVKMIDKEHDGTASILAPIGVQPVHAFSEDRLDMSVYAGLIRDAEKELF